MLKSNTQRVRKASEGVIVIGLGMFAIGIISGYFLTNILTPAVKSSVKRANDKEYAYINPLLSCDISENKEFTEYQPLEKQIQSIVHKEDSQKVASVSVYYREFNTGKWFSVNPDELYSPASLLKVPIMIAYLKQAEITPSILLEKITYTGTNALSNEIEHYRSPDDITPGDYTVEQLVQSMIHNSDNAATNLLYQAMNITSLIEVMSDIGIRIPQDKEDLATTDFLTVKSYSYLFRLLYNSTYLSRAMSEKALDLLSRTNFAQGIRGGIPKDIVVAGKFGERTIQNSKGEQLDKELHDCGIVYYPKHPYLLCVMTKGQDFDALSGVIQDISSAIYTNVDTRFKK